MSGTAQLDSDSVAQLAEICRAIAARRLSHEQWSQVESSDEFQSDSLVGGFDATEGLFTFSYFDGAGIEWWFDLTLERALAAAEGRGVSVELRKPQ